MTLHTQAVEYARASGVPLAQVAVPLSGVAFIAGGVSVVLGLWADAGALLASATLLVITITMHPFWRFEGDERARAGQAINFLKNAGMIGGLLVVAWANSESSNPPLLAQRGRS